MNNIIFITGTNTGVGKTYFLCKILEYIYTFFPNLKPKVIGYKLIETGVENFPEDALKISKVMEKYLPPVYTFKYPLSPYDAANLEGRKIFKKILVEKLKKLSQSYSLVFVEGAGGIEVPIFPYYTFLDFIKELNLKTILVSPNKLGTINDTLLSSKAIDNNLVGIYFNKVNENLASSVNIKTINLFLKKKYNLNPFISDSIEKFARFILKEVLWT
ncbi:MAG TPA: dethiobiotin synthase [Aquificae bacterium]|nr:dethiobiotin synthase [Aquificota bacterium]